jgi:hypothetical protein
MDDLVYTLLSPFEGVDRHDTLTDEAMTKLSAQYMQPLVDSILRPNHTRYKETHNGECPTLEELMNFSSPDIKRELFTRSVRSENSQAPTE